MSNEEFDWNNVEKNVSENKNKNNEKKRKRGLVTKKNKYNI
jgi:hypothetical protein